MKLYKEIFTKDQNPDGPMVPVIRYVKANEVGNTFLEPIEVKPGMSLQECKDEVAKARGYEDWRHFKQNRVVAAKYNDGNLSIINITVDQLLNGMNEAAELYASSQIIALKEENERLREELTLVNSNARKLANALKPISRLDENADSAEALKSFKQAISEYQQLITSDLSSEDNFYKSQADKLANGIEKLLKALGVDEVREAISFSKEALKSYREK